MVSPNRLVRRRGKARTDSPNRSSLREAAVLSRRTMNWLSSLWSSRVPASETTQRCGSQTAERRQEHAADRLAPER